MMYRCKILTDDFLAKLDKYIQASTKNIKDENDRLKKQNDIRKAMYHMWNNPQSFSDHPNIQKYYEKLNLWKPEYMEMSFVASERLNTIPHITWIGQLCKISDIPEIFAYKKV